MTKEEIKYEASERYSTVGWRTDLHPRIIREQEAFIAGAAYATQEKQGWVKTSERLPELVTDVICFTPSGYGVEVLCFDGDGKFYHEQSDSERIVTHWMPLPTKPEM